MTKNNKHRIENTFKQNILSIGFIFILAGGIAFIPFSVEAENIAMDKATLRALDKVTGRTKLMELAVGSTVEFGTMSIKVNVCKTRPPEEPPENAVFLEIENAPSKGKEKIKIFSGWMFSSSPALSALKSPLYDVWLVKCSGNKIEHTADTSPNDENNASANSEENEPIVTIEPEVIVIEGGTFVDNKDESIEDINNIEPTVFYE